MSPVLIRTNGPLQIMDLADLSCLLHWIFVFWVLVNSFSCGHLHSLRCRRGGGTLTSVKCSQHSTLENEAASWVLPSYGEVGPEVVKRGRKSVAWTCGHVRIWHTCDLISLRSQFYPPKRGKYSGVASKMARESGYKFCT